MKTVLIECWQCIDQDVDQVQIQFLIKSIALRPCYTKQFFLQLATQWWRIKNLSSCRGGVTRWQLFSQLATHTTNKMAEISRQRKMSSDFPILTKLHCKLPRGCHMQATCLATLWKVGGHSTFLATRNATIAVAKWGVKHEFFLATCNATFVALQVARKITSCNMALTLAADAFTYSTCDPITVQYRSGRNNESINLTRVTCCIIQSNLYSENQRFIPTFHETSRWLNIKILTWYNS